MNTAKKQTESKSNGTVDEFGQKKFQEAYKLAGEATSDMMSAIKDTTKVNVDSGIEKAGELTSKAELVVVKRPFVSIGCAFAAGLIISRLMK